MKARDGVAVGAWALAIAMAPVAAQVPRVT